MKAMENYQVLQQEGENRGGGARSATPAVIGSGEDSTQRRNWRRRLCQKGWTQPWLQCAHAGIKRKGKGVSEEETKAQKAGYKAYGDGRRESERTPCVVWNFQASADVTQEMILFTKCNLIIPLLAICPNIMSVVSQGDISLMATKGLSQ